MPPFPHRHEHDEITRPQAPADEQTHRRDNPLVAGPPALYTAAAATRIAVSFRAGCGSPARPDSVPLAPGEATEYDEADEADDEPPPEAPDDGQDDPHDHEDAAKSDPTVAHASVATHESRKRKPITA